MKLLVDQLNTTLDRLADGGPVSWGAPMDFVDSTWCAWARWGEDGHVLIAGAKSMEVALKCLHNELLAMAPEPTAEQSGERTVCERRRAASWPL